MASVYRSFADLTPHQLYQILRLRSQVFVVEQQSLFVDPDGYDTQALHGCVWDDAILAGCLRILPPGIKHDDPSIGRFCIAPAYRGTGLGREMFQSAIDRIADNWPDAAILLDAQRALSPYYARFGFVENGEPYDDGGIEHIPMIRSR